MPQKHKVAARPHQAQPEAQPTAKKPDRFLAVLVIASIAVVILGIILLKDRPQEAAALSSAQNTSPTTQSNSPTVQTSAMAPSKSAAAVAGPFKPSSPADQLNQALAGGKPALVFMHSNNCQSCIDMMKVVNQVYPEFANQVVLIDVDVYDDANSPLMQKLGLRYIPTVVTFDKAGKSAQNVGAMKADAFRTFLRQRALGS
jgi:thiol-disulfide isomerase/thioredoxin